jgi:hypothetical protein
MEQRSFCMRLTLYLLLWQWYLITHTYRDEGLRRGGDDEHTALVCREGSNIGSKQIQLFASMSLPSVSRLYKHYFLITGILTGNNYSLISNYSERLKRRIRSCLTYTQRHRPNLSNSRSKINEYLNANTGLRDDRPDLQLQNNDAFRKWAITTKQRKRAEGVRAPQTQ